MALHATTFYAGVVGIIALFALPSVAQTVSKAAAVTAPDYGSGASAGILANSNFNTPEANGRPGVKFFALGVQAFREHDYRHAVDMYKVAASWAYKPAEYNLGIMYFKGQGVPVDRARGAAWMILAAERGAPQYTRARDLLVTLLSDAEFKRTDTLWIQLQATYGDKVALRRAKAEWAWVRTHQTGTRVGGVSGELHVGSIAPHGTRAGGAVPVKHSWVDYLTGDSVDGSIAYRQFHQSDNPYDPAFLQGHRNGKVTVEPLQKQPSGDGAAKSHSKGSPSPHHNR